MARKESHFLCSAYVGVIILGCIQALTLLTSLILWATAESDEHKRVFSAFSAFTSFFLMPFIWVWWDPDNVRARLALFWFDFTNWVLWLVACHMLLTDIWGFGVVLPANSVANKLRSLHLGWIALGYFVYFEAMRFLLAPIWSFYIEKRDGLKD